jgi:hypothetical protein
MFRTLLVEGSPRTSNWLTIGFLVLAALPLSGGTLLVSNFGPGNTFDPSTGDSWATGGGNESGNAVGFVDPTSSTYNLTQIQVADNFFIPSTDGGMFDNLNVGIWQNTTNDLNGATELESWSLTTSTLQTAQLFTLTSLLNPAINPADFYFITETVTPDPSAGATQAEWGWQWNNLNPIATGYYSEFAGGSWFPEMGPTPVFSVSGNLSPSTVPEPQSYVALLALGLVGMLILRHRQRSRQ